MEINVELVIVNELSSNSNASFVDGAVPGAVIVNELSFNSIASFVDGAVPGAVIHVDGEVFGYWDDLCSLCIYRACIFQSSASEQFFKELCSYKGRYVQIKII